MKKVIISLLLAVFTFIAFTGCSSSEGGKKGSKAETSSGVAYIPIRNEFFDSMGHFFPDGKAYSDLLNDADYENTAEFKLAMLNTLFLDGDDFFQWGIAANFDERKYYSGTFSMGTMNILDLEYQYYKSYGNDYKEYILDLKNEKANFENVRMLEVISTQLTEANDNNCVLDSNIVCDDTDKSMYMCHPYLYNYASESEHKFDRMRPGNSRFPLQLYSKGDFLVVKQKGYSFDGDVSKKKFTIKFDDSEYAGEKACSSKMTFNKDNTWQSEIDKDWYISGKGKWTLMNDNLLVIYPPEGEEKNNIIESQISVMYLDFEDEEIYFPAYIRCDDLIKFADEFQENK